MKKDYGLAKASLVIVLLFMALRSSAQLQDRITSSSDIVIEGVISDSPGMQQKSERIVAITISKYPFDSSTQSRIPHERYEIKVSANRPFKFIFPAPADLCYMYIGYSKEGAVVDWQFFDNEYMLQKGDRLNCTLSLDYFSFSGKGAEKLNCQSAIYKKNYVITEDVLKLYNTKDYRKMLAITGNKMDSILKLQTAIVEQYRPKIGDSLSNILLANCYGLKYYTWLRGFRAQTRNTGLYSALMNSRIYGQMDSALSNNKIDLSAIASSYIYTNLLFEKTLMQSLIFKNDTVENRNSEDYRRRVFQAIKSGYTGLIRDKIICLYIIQYLNFPSTVQYAKESIILVQSPFYRSILTDILNTKSPDLPFYPFELENTNGETVKLTDFNGKVVILDFWFTGCENCINLQKAMASVHQKFRSNQKVVFVSVCIDKTKSKWLNSVSKGIYTDPESINLYTGGLGTAHPLIQKYNISIYPTLFLLKNSKIYSTNPPRPLLDSESLQATTSGETGKFITMIEKALN